MNIIKQFKIGDLYKLNFSQFKLNVEQKFPDIENKTFLTLKDDDMCINLGQINYNNHIKMIVLHLKTSKKITIFPQCLVNL